MRNSLILLLLCLNLTLSGATYYVSPSGSDSNPGTITLPFFTLNKAWSVVTAGDIIYMRGGTYRYNKTGTNIQGKDGTANNMISILAYPGEKPVINYDNQTFTSQLVALSMQNADYIYMKGIRVTSINQPVSGSIAQYGILLWDDVSHCIFEQMELDHIGGWGIVVGDNSNSNLFLNCDSHHNSDPYSINGEPYGWSDGFESASTTSTNNILRGCRFWSNSDDGLDLRRSNGIYLIENCWSFWNGYKEDGVTPAGNGEGFKIGGKSAPATTNILRTVRNCLAFENRSVGFSPEPDLAENEFGAELYNCTSYHNALGINFEYNNTAIVKNNIVYANTLKEMYGWGKNVTHDHNTLDLSLTVTNADFVSVSSVGADGPRQADGSLPNFGFLHLASGSHLLDAGVDVGLTYSGKAPDLGAYEGTGTPVPVTVPVFQTSAVENATPSLLEMTYDITLANIVPSVSSFSVMVNSVARTVNAVAISGTKVQLTLTSPIVNGNVVTVSYTKPSTNPIQTTSGGQAITIGAQTVTNKVNAVIPVYVSSAVQNATPSLLEMTYNMTLANIVPAVSSFSVIINSVVRTVNTVVISGTKVQLTLASPIVFGDVVTISYTKPSASPLQTSAGGQAITIGAQAVAINVLGINPVYVSSSVANTTPSLLEMTYNIPLANIVPVSSSFSVLVNSVVRTVNTVVIAGTKVQLTLSSRIFPNDIVTVSYTKPSGSPLQTTQGGIAITISNQQVLNNCINVAPTAAITSPGDRSSFTAPANITITANASDADGSVSFVEFYNGNIKLGSNSAAPYSFVWNNVAEGTFSITVIATDNLNAKTTSSAISISVIKSTLKQNKHPYVKIHNPRKGNIYEALTTIEIDAEASDPDGTIEKVEFYNGSVRLVELTAAPYVYTWKDVIAGNYKITAVATDNLKDTTVSSTVEFMVGPNIKYDANSDIVKLYPNPNNGHFSIEFINPMQSEKGVVIITDLAGKQVYNGPVLKEETLKHIDMSDSRNGMYVMMIKDKEILVTKKFIKN